LFQALLSFSQIVIANGARSGFADRARQGLQIEPLEVC